MLEGQRSVRHVVRGFVVRTLVALALLAATSEGQVDRHVRLAVMEFTNTSSDRQLDNLGKGLQSMVTTDLSQVASLTLVERARLQDIQSELKLGRSAIVDPRTAVKFGKLAGASHLVAGSFTILGDKMRLDGRIFTVADGSVVLAEQIEGDRDAFFELEKALVKKIADAVGLKLQVKERAAIAKIHTTDFDAFREFSNGIALFDEKKYDASIEALRAAQSRDQEFKLATVTLAEYEGIIGQLQARANQLQLRQDEIQSLEQQKEARGEAEALKKLYEIAGRQDATNRLDRLAALYLLATAYGGISTREQPYRMHALEDRFGLQRITDTLVQTYWAEASAIFPRVLPVVRDDLAFTPRTPEQVAEAMAKARALLEKEQAPRRSGCPPGETREATILCNLRWHGDQDDPISEFPLRLHLDGRQTVELYQRLYDFGLQLNPPLEWRQEALETLAEDYRRLGDFNRATAMYTQLAGILHDAAQVRAVVQKIKDIHEIAMAIERSPNQRLIRELIFNRHEPIDPFDVDAFGRNYKFLLEEVTSSREFPTQDSSGRHFCEFVLVDNHLVWQVQSEPWALVTGPRTDPRRAQAIRYASSWKEEAIDNLLVVDGAARHDVRLSFEVDFTRPADFAEQSVFDKVPEGLRPEIGFMFGARDIFTDRAWKSKEDGSWARNLESSFRALAVIMGDHNIRLEQLVSEEKGDGLVLGVGVAQHGMAIVHKELRRYPADLRSARTLRAAFEVTGNKVTATVNGTIYSFPLPNDHQGFYGLSFTGRGFAELHALQVSTK